MRCACRHCHGNARGQRPRSSPRATFPNIHFCLSPIRCCLSVECGTPLLWDSLSKREITMQRTFVFAVILSGLTAAHAQTSGSAGVGTDPLSVPTQTLPSAGGGGGAGAGAAGGSTAVGVGASASSSITAPASTNPQSALQLPGETPATSTDAAKVTTRAALGGSSSSPSSQSTSCQVSVPSTDGGSTNLTDIFGSGSPGGC